MARTCPACGYGPVGPFIDNCPICAEPVRNVRESRNRDGPSVGGLRAADLPPVVRWLLGGLTVAVLGVLLCCGVGLSWLGKAARNQAHHNAPPLPVLLRTETVELGEFEVVSGELAICDPAYGRPLVRQGDIATMIRGVRPGKWSGRAILHVIDTPTHKRCGELLAFAVDSPLPPAPAWREVHRDVGVDSGQAGFFDWKHFRSADAVPPNYPWKQAMLVPDDPWYSMCADVTLHGNGAGTIPYGVVSSSGWGDGGYPAHALRDADGAVIALRLVFIAADEYGPPPSPGPISTAPASRPSQRDESAP